MIPLAWKFNSKQLLCKTLNSRINIVETRAVLKKENFQVEVNLGFLKLMMNFSANTSIDDKCLNLFKKGYFETC